MSNENVIKLEEVKKKKVIDSITETCIEVLSYYMQAKIKLFFMSFEISEDDLDFINNNGGDSILNSIAEDCINYMNESILPDYYIGTKEDERYIQYIDRTVNEFLIDRVSNVEKIYKNRIK